MSVKSTQWNRLVLSKHDKLLYNGDARFSFGDYASATRIAIPPIAFKVEHPLTPGLSLDVFFGSTSGSDAMTFEDRPSASIDCIISKDSSLRRDCFQTLLVCPGFIFVS